MPSFFRTSITVLIGSLVLLTVPLSRGDGGEGLFGESQRSEAALIGMMYDLKTKEKGFETTPTDYGTVLGEFLGKNWDERLLNRFYRVSRPLYTTQIFIPSMNADLAPKAFGAEKTVQPSRWAIHYKGQVAPPSGGTYRFWGCADDMMAVAINGKNELVFCRPDMALPGCTWRQTEPSGAPVGDTQLVPGDWFSLGAREVIDLDVMIGERPGGLFNAFLLIETKGVAYERDAQGHLILPIFQLAPYDTPSKSDSTRQPRFSPKSEPWKCYQ